MKYRSKRIRVFFSSVLFFLLHLPFVFARTKPVSNIPVAKPAAVTTEDNASAVPPVSAFSKMMIYDSLRLGSLGLARQAFACGIQGWTYLVEKGRLLNRNIISIVDFSKSSAEKRLFVIDLSRVKLLYNTYVAHGMNSGLAYASDFSNMPESNKSSVGFYQTLGTYYGANGYSLRLAGLERGYNDNAERRDIVIHGADYVHERYIHSQGYIGRSWGCPALPQSVSRPIINKIKNGTCLFIYAPKEQYLKQSRIVNHP